MKNRMFLILLFLLLPVMLLWGCEKDVPEETSTEPSTEEELVYEYTRVSIQDFEPYSDSLFMSAGAEQTIIDGNTYEFERSIPEDVRNTFVDNQRALFTLIGERTDFVLTGYTFRILENYESRTLSEEHKAYFDIGSSGTWEQALITMQLLMGDYTNYGYLYALGDDLAEDLSWTRETNTIEPSVFTDEPMMLSLVYPCFNRVYSTEKEIQSAKALSVELFGNMTAPYVGEEAFLAAIEAYGEAEHIEYEPTYLRFANNGTHCPLRAQGKYIEFLRDDTFEEDGDLETRFLEEDWALTVSTMIAAFEETEAELEAVCAAFEFTPEKLLPTILTDTLQIKGNGDIISCDGLFYSDEDIVYTRSLSAILHEYVHYIYDQLAAENSYESWHTEALAYYFSRETYFEMWLHSSGESAEDEFALLTGKDLTDADVFMEIMDTFIYVLREEYKPKFWISQSTTTSEVLSIASYIVQNYGEEGFIQLMLYPQKARLLTGKTLEEIEEDWSDYILYEKEYPEEIKMIG